MQLLCHSCLELGGRASAAASLATAVWVLLLITHTTLNLTASTCWPAPRFSAQDQPGRQLHSKLQSPLAPLQVPVHDPLLCCAAAAAAAGITAEMLQGVSTRLEDVQALLLELVAAETLVVTHSGENDLQALKVGEDGGVWCCAEVVRCRAFCVR